MKQWFAFLVIFASALSYSAPFHVQAHRGASGQLLENTIDSIAEAARLGADSIELDVHLTKDKKWVVFHDFILEKGCCYVHDPKEPNREDLLILNTPSKEILKYKVLPAFSKRMNKPYKGAEERSYALPSLQALVDEINKVEKEVGRKVVLDIEIKSNQEHPNESAPPAELAQRMNEFLKQNKKVEQYLVRSFDLRVLKELQKLNPDVRIAVLSDEKVGDFVSHAKGIKAEILAPNVGVLSKEKIAMAHKKGMKVIPWTVNDESLIAKIKRLGVDGVTTDHPARVMKKFSSLDNCSPTAIGCN